MQLEYSQQIFEICSDLKFHENLSGANRVVPCGRTHTHTHTHTHTDRETDRQTDRHIDFKNAPEKWLCRVGHHLH
jgi:hypothetical protein